MKFLIKIMIYFGLIIGWDIFKISYGPILMNQLAMNQMQNVIESNIGISLYTYALNHETLIFIALLIGLFTKDIIKIYYRVKETKENKE